MGSVEVAVREDAGFSRVVAIKRLHPHLLDEESFVAMFIDEARLAAMIRHANVAGVLDVGHDERGPFFVMDYVEGVSLSRAMQHHARRGELLPLQICLRIAKQACEGLHAAHELCGSDGTPLELVHRDVSPQNVLIGFDGVVRLVDFGIAKALGRIAKTALGTLKGKFGYMSPEQLRYEAVDRRSDLFAIGVLLHEMLTGARLYDGESQQAARRILVEPPPDASEQRADVPPSLQELAFELLAKDREQRPHSAYEVARRLDAMISECVAEEGSLELSEYVRHAFADAIETSRRDLAAAMQLRSQAAVEATSRDSARTVTPSDKLTRVEGAVVRRSRWWAALLAAALLATVAGALGLSRSTSKPPAVTVTVTRASEPAVAEPAAAASASAVVVPELAPSATDQARARARKERGPSRSGTSAGIPVWAW